MIGEIMFNCKKCGQCCSNLDKSPLYSDLDRGDGVCIHYDENTHLCKIYEERPLKCNVDKMYEAVFNKIMTKEEYYKQNYVACKSLK